MLCCFISEFLLRCIAKTNITHLEPIIYWLSLKNWQKLRSRVHKWWWSTSDQSTAINRFHTSCSPALASRRPRTGATGRCRQRDDAGITTPRWGSSTFMLAASENSLRPSRDKRWATGGQLPSLIRRPPSEADVVDVVRVVRLTDVANGQRRGCPTDETATGIATAHLWRGRCRRSGREPTLHQAPIRPRRRSGVVVRPQHVRIHLPPESTE